MMHSLTRCTPDSLAGRKHRDSLPGARRSRGPGELGAHTSRAKHVARFQPGDAEVESATIRSGTAAQKTLLIIGGTGTTGQSAINGLVGAGGQTVAKVQALTRHPTSATALTLAARDIQPVACDLDGDVGALELALAGADIVYCHAFSTDAKVADPAEVTRAQRLANAAAAAGVMHLVYNSSAGRGCGYNITHMDQKHKVEDVLAASGVPLTCLRATMFMEEFWKQYTRPPIISKGSFPFALAPNKKLQLLAARDMGLVLGHVLRAPDQFKGQAIDLAGDELTPTEMAEAFTRHQPPLAADGKSASPTPVRQLKMPGLLLWFMSADLHRIHRFLSEQGYSADVAALRQRFPGMLTFDQFLTATHWSDGSRTYQQGVQYDNALLPRM